MAGASLFALIDDIASILDDVALMTKVAAKKTAGVLGDDLALNTQQVSGVRAERELPVVWAVAKGSLLNKAILVPFALLISAFLPWLVMPLLMLGGLYLCFEGVEKLAHKYLHDKESRDAEHQEALQQLADPETDLVAVEKAKIKGAIRTDFVLSAEIIVIALGVVAHMDLLGRLLTLIGIALLMTVGVYGVVAILVKLDDLGLYLFNRNREPAKTIGRALLAAVPKMMKLLTIVGTLAMFLVGGGLIIHGVEYLHHLVEHLSTAAGALGFAVGPLADLLIGLVAGTLVLLVVTGVKRLRDR